LFPDALSDFHPRVQKTAAAMEDHHLHLLLEPQGWLKRSERDGMIAVYLKRGRKATS
jgi:hypothetical protein